MKNLMMNDKRSLTDSIVRGSIVDKERNNREGRVILHSGCVVPTTDK